MNPTLEPTVGQTAPTDADPLLEVLKIVYQQKNEFTEGYNRDGNPGDGISASVMGLLACKVMMRLTEIMPRETCDALNKQALAAVPLVDVSSRRRT
jgi:hypothetical protein